MIRPRPLAWLWAPALAFALAAIGSAQNWPTVEPAQPAGEDETTTEELQAPVDGEATSAEDDATPTGERAQSLVELLEARARTRERLTALQAELQTDEALGREAEIQAEIAEQSAELERLERDFRGIAARVEVGAFVDDEGARVSLTDEVRELLDPLIGELKRATSRPREIDRLKGAISEAKARQDAIAEALSNIAGLLEDAEDPRLVQQLEAERDFWLERRRDVQTEYSIAKQLLDQRLESQVSPGEVLSNFFNEVLRNRGGKLLVAGAAALAFLFVLNRAHLLLTRKRTTGERRRLRVLNVLYLFGRLVGAVLVFVLVLYLFDEWVLLVLVALLLFGIFWATKDAVPKFWTQAVLLLDAGPVREFERVLYDGLPWRVGTISFYTDLVNPALSGGRLRLPIGDLSDLRSRKSGAEEPWFPTDKDDWIVVGDGTFGQVILQTREQVRVQELGGAIKVYPTLDFVAATPLVLSNGFRLQSRIEIDYEYRPIAPTEAPSIIEEYATQALASSKWSEQVVKVGAEYESAGASSLVILLQADFDGSAGADYNALSRHLARVSLEVCNEHGWEIPFTQITVHRAEDGAQH